ncbi:MAG: hypothetical protein IT261_05285 [Saprospiraceae bacterium]|nr:hypothetical protein [Saprospiraceae bacterium]
MKRMKILLAVTTYPQPSRSYDELVCTAGLLEDGTWVRLYPVPLSFLSRLKKDGVVQTTKYTWIELNVKSRTDDFRPESHSPADYEFKDWAILEHLGTEHNWERRKEICLKKVYTNLTELIEHSKDPQNLSLATFKPTRITAFEVDQDDRDWKDVWIQLKQQKSLFSDPDSEQVQIRKVPYKFYYRFEDEKGRSARLMIEDWEIGQLYWNCLRDAKNDEQQAIAKVKLKYDVEFRLEKDIYFFLGTTSEWHRRRAPNPFVIIGVFYPKKEQQLSPFLNATPSKSPDTLPYH